MTRRRAGAPALLALLALCLTWPALARPEGGEATDPNAAYRVAPAQADGFQVSRVYVYLRNPSGDEAADAKTRAAIEDAFGIRAGGPYLQFRTDVAASQVRRLAFVKDVEVRLYSTTGGGEVTIALLVTLLGADEPKPAAPKAGVVATGEPGQLPLLWKDERGMAKLIVNPSTGAYVDRNPWLGNPDAFVGDPEKEATLAHLEYGMEVGVGGIVGLGRSPVFLFGAASYVFTGTLGIDAFSTDSARGHGEMEDLYGGIVVAPPSSRQSFRLSAGRQKFSLNRNFLMGHVLGATNAGDRAATDLSPRNAYDLVVDADWQIDRFGIRGFFARANELPANDTKTEYAGVNLTYNDGRRVDASLAFIAIPSSKATVLFPDGATAPREGLRAINPRARWTSAFGVEGLWLEAEWAHQWSTSLDMSADGWGVWAGYAFTKAKGRPAALYRYSVLTGDDPSTATYERFDTMTGGVQRDWLHGMAMTQVARGRNLRVHRVELSVKPRPGMDLSVDLYDYSADTLNNLGGQRALPTYASSHLGREVTPTLQWMFNRNLYVQALATYLIPGKGLRDSLPEPTHVWQAYKLSLYWFF
jgi:hypothetical protein